MSYENKGTTTANVIVTSGSPDSSGNFVVGAADPAVVIEAAWTYLTVFGGGTLVTKGAGETWTCQSTIDSQGGNITWISDWSLTITVDADRHMVLVQNHDYITLIGLYLLGLRTATIGNGIYGINAEYLWIYRCKLEDTANWGAIIYRTGSHHGVVRDCEILDPYGNGVEFADSDECHAYGVEYDQDPTGAAAFSTALQLFGTSGSSFESCTVHRCLLDGMSLHAGIDNKILSCDITAGHYGLLIGNELVEGGFENLFDCLIADSTFRGSLDPDEDPETNGIAINPQNGYAIGRLIIRDNQIDYWRHGIVASIGATGVVYDITIRGNQIRRIREDMIRVANGSGGDADRIRALDNECFGQDTHPESFYGVNFNTVIDAEIKRNKLINIGKFWAANADTINVTNGPRADIGGNKLIGCDGARYGIHLNNCDDSKIYDNSLEDTPIGVYITDGDDVMIGDNRFINNTTSAIDINRAAAVSTHVDGNNMEGCAAGCVDGAATTPMYGNNVNAAGTMTRDVVPP